GRGPRVAGCACGGREVVFVRADALTPTFSHREREQILKTVACATVLHLPCRLGKAKPPPDTHFQALCFSQFSTTSWWLLVLKSSNTCSTLPSASIRKLMR